MRGLALEGGGSRGAYHIGVVKAFYEKGYDFDGFTGTSIGAINAAALAQGDFDLVLDLWTRISAEHIFNEDEQLLLQLAKLDEQRVDKVLPQKIKNAVSKVLENRGINTEKIKIFLGRYLDEDKIRGSGKDFGLVTVSVSDRKPHELMLEEIAHGQLLNYIMASASFPGFRPEVIDNKAYIDGAFHDNCPYNLLLRRGYGEVIAVRTNTLGILRKAEDSERVRIISPSKNLGKLMSFSPENNIKNIELGYTDALNYLENNA